MGESFFTGVDWDCAGEDDCLLGTLSQETDFEHRHRSPVARVAESSGVETSIRLRARPPV